MPWKALKTASGTGWKEIDREVGSGWKALLWDSVALDVGPACINRSGAQNSGKTMVAKTNPVNADGTITSLCVWAASGMGGVYVGMFYLVSGTTYKCRSASSVGALDVGQNSDISVSLACLTGDMIGIYWATGTIEAIGSGGGGVHYVSGNTCVVDNESSYGEYPVFEGSYYGTG